MKPQTLFSPKYQALGQVQVMEAAVVFLAGLAIPFFVHLIPYSGSVPLGTHLLAVFYVPLVAAVLFKRSIVLSAVALVPVIKFLITGTPSLNIVLLLTIELMVFVWVVQKLMTNQKIKWLVGPLGFLAAKSSSMLVVLIIPPILPEVTAWEFGWHALSNSIYGLLVLNLITFLIMEFKKA